MRTLNRKFFKPDWIASTCPLLGAIALGAVIFFQAESFAQDRDPNVVFVEGLILEIRQHLAGTEPTDIQHQRVCGLVTDSTDWRQMTIKALGPEGHVYKPEELEPLQRSLRNLLKQTVSTTLSRTLDSQIEVDPRARRMGQEQVVSVSATKPGSNDRLDVKFNVRAQNGQLLLSDASFKGLSLMASLRGEFDRVRSESERDGGNFYQTLLQWLGEQAPACP